MYNNAVESVQFSPTKVFNSQQPRCLVSPPYSPCQSLYDDTYCIGSVAQFSEKEIEEGMTKLAELMEKRKEHDFECERCFLQESCDHGCSAMAMQQSGSILGDDGDCMMRKANRLKELRNKYL